MADKMVFVKLVRCPDPDVFEKGEKLLPHLNQIGERLAISGARAIVRFGIEKVFTIALADLEEI